MAGQARRLFKNHNLVGIGTGEKLEAGCLCPGRDHEPLIALAAPNPSGYSRLCQEIGVKLLTTIQHIQGSQTQCCFFRALKLHFSPSSPSHISLISFEACYFNCGKKRHKNSAAMMPVMPIKRAGTVYWRLLGPSCGFAVAVWPVNANPWWGWLAAPARYFILKPFPALRRVISEARLPAASLLIFPFCSFSLA